MDRDQQELIRDLLRNTQKTDRNALMVAIVIAVQAVSIAFIEARFSQVKDEACDRIGLLK